MVTKNLAGAASFLSPATAHAAPDPDQTGKNLVLVHGGAFPDGSNLDKVIPIPKSKSLHVTAVQNPLTYPTFVSSGNNPLAFTLRTSGCLAV
jgi:hypothetical protein